LKKRIKLKNSEEKDVVQFADDDDDDEGDEKLPTSKRRAA
jgi:hypothetical protein